MKKKFLVGMLVAGVFATMISPNTVHAFDINNDIKGDCNGTIEKLIYRYEDGNPTGEIEKITYTYDSQNRPIEQLFYSYDSETQTYFCDEKNTNDYDANGNLIKEIHYSYSEAAKGMVEQSKNIYEYSENGLVTSYTRISGGKNYEKDTYEYVTGTNLVSKQIHYEPDDSYQFVEKYSISYSYYENNLVKQRTYCVHKDDGLDYKQNVTDYEYNENNLETLFKTQSFNTQTMRVTSYMECSSTYDTQNRILSIEEITYTNTEKTYEKNRTKTTYEYEGDVITITYKTADYGGAYTNYKKEIKEENDLLDRYEVYSWEEDEWESNFGEKYTYELNEDGKVSKITSEELNVWEEWEIYNVTTYTYPEKVVKSGIGALAIILICFGSLIVIASGLFAAWKIEEVKAGIEATTRKLKFLDKIANPINNLFAKIFKNWKK